MRVLLLAAIGITFFALMPLTISIPIAPDNSPTAIGSTVVVGIFLHLRNANWGKQVQFRAIWIHYRTHWMTTWSMGVLHGLQLVTLNRNFFGILRNHLVWAKFDGQINIQ
jgi:hypothetical protein